MKGESYDTQVGEQQQDNRRPASSTATLEAEASVYGQANKTWHHFTNSI
jgi:hypothetical protein